MIYNIALVLAIQQIESGIYRFFSDYFPSSTNGLEFRVGEFCAKVNQILKEHKGKEAFRVVPSPDERGSILVDRWGTPYNFCTVAERQRNHWPLILSC